MGIVAEMFMGISIYMVAKAVLTGVTWFGLSSTRKNIGTYIETIKQKPSSRKRPRITQLTMRLKLLKIMALGILIPGLGEIFFFAITLGRFSNKSKIKRIYERALQRTDNDNLEDALARIGEPNLSVYKSLRKDVGFLSSHGHSEIARQIILTLNNLLIEANISGINLKIEPYITASLHDTAELVATLLKKEQSGIQSNIDSYLNVVESIKGDIIEKKSVFMDGESIDHSNLKHD